MKKLSLFHFPTLFHPSFTQTFLISACCLLGISCTQDLSKPVATPKVHEARKADSKIESSFAISNPKKIAAAFPTSTSTSTNRMNPSLSAPAIANGAKPGTSALNVAAEISVDNSQLSPEKVEAILRTNPTNANQIILKKDALGKAFILMPTMIVASGTPIIDHLAPKIVSFEKHGDELALIELNADAVYNNLKSDKLLEVFKVTNETTDSITFAWDYKLNAIPLADVFSGGLTDVPTQKSDTSLTSIYPVQKSFIRKAELNNNQLEIEQISLVTLPNIPLSFQTLLATLAAGGGGLTQEYKSLTVKLFLQLKPYNPNTKYKKRTSPFKKGIGTFEIALPRSGDGSLDYYSTLWELDSTQQEPLTCAIAKGAPKEYLQAIIEGCLYWNKVAEKEIIKIKTEVEPENLNLERTILVHWIPFDQAGFARASLQSDPLTGEILKADVYLTSTFAKGASLSIRKALQDVGSNPEKILKSYSLLPQNFKSSAICNYTPKLTDQLESSEALSPKETTGNEKIIAEYIQNELRHTTAHEVGHTLGLRHNFAGSLETEFPSFKDFLDRKNKYIKGEASEGARISSSVMDYIFGNAGSMLGAFIKNNGLNYDKKVIEWAYTKEYNPESVQLPVFCSDGLVGSSIGCQIGDLGKTPLETNVYTAKNKLEKMATTMLQLLVMGFHPKNPNDKMNIREAFNQFSNYDFLSNVQKAIMSELDVTKLLLTKKAQLFELDIIFGKKSWLNETEYEKAYEERIKLELKSLNGVGGIIGLLYPMDAKTGLPKKFWLKPQLMEYVSRPDFKKGKTIEGLDYELSSEEISFINKLIENYSGLAEEAWLYTVMKTFTFSTGSGGIDILGSLLSSMNGQTDSSKDDEIIILPYLNQEQWWASLANIAIDLMTAKEQKDLEIKINDQTYIVQKSLYSLDFRKKLVPILKPTGYDINKPDIQKQNTDKAKELILKRINSVLAEVVKRSMTTTPAKADAQATATATAAAKAAAEAVAATEGRPQGQNGPVAPDPAAPGTKEAAPSAAGSAAPSLVSTNGSSTGGAGAVGKENAATSTTEEGKSSGAAAPSVPVAAASSNSGLINLPKNSAEFNAILSLLSLDSVANQWFKKEIELLKEVEGL